MPRPPEQKLLFVSQNQHKVKEMKRLLPPTLHLLGLADIGWTKEIPEPFDTFEANATHKAAFVFARTGLPCFADDSGLEVEALQGKPGVFSARYAGEPSNSEANVEKVLAELGDRDHRAARFVDVIAYAEGNGLTHIFRGEVEGRIPIAVMGQNGFGYDPIFIPAGFDQTFGQLPSSLKDRISHRAKAIRLFLSYLN